MPAAGEPAADALATKIQAAARGWIERMAAAPARLTAAEAVAGLLRRARWGSSAAQRRRAKRRRRASPHPNTAEEKNAKSTEKSTKNTKKASPQGRTSQKTRPKKNKNKKKKKEQDEAGVAGGAGAAPPAPPAATPVPIYDWDLTLEALGRLGALSESRVGAAHIVDCPGALHHLLDLLRCTVEALKSNEPPPPEWHFSNKPAAEADAPGEEKSARIARARDRLQEHNAQCQNRVCSVVLRLLATVVQLHQDRRWYDNRTVLATRQPALPPPNAVDAGDSTASASDADDDGAQTSKDHPTVPPTNDETMQALAAYLFRQLVPGEFFSDLRTDFSGLALRLLSRALETKAARAHVLERPPTTAGNIKKNKGTKKKTKKKKQGDKENAATQPPPDEVPKPFAVLVALLDDRRLGSPRRYACVIRCLVLLVRHSEPTRRRAVEDTDVIEAVRDVLSEFGRAKEEEEEEEEGGGEGEERAGKKRAGPGGPGGPGGDKHVVLQGVALFSALAHKYPEAVVDLLACDCIAMFVHFMIAFHDDSRILQTIFGFFVSVLVNGGPKAGLEIVPDLANKICIGAIVTAVRMFPGSHTLCRMGCKLLGTIASVVVVNPKERDLESGSDVSDSEGEEESDDDVASGGFGGGVAAAGLQNKKKLKVPTRAVLLYRIFIEERVQQVICDAVERLGKNGRGAVLTETGELDRNTPWGEVQGVADFLIMWCGGMKVKNERYL